MAAEYGIALTDLVMVHTPRIDNLIKDRESMIAST